MMLKRTFDAALFNRVMEHPEVRPYLGFKDNDSIDASPVVRDAANVCLANEFGGFILFKQAPGIYEVHVQFLPEFRGKRALEAARETARFMFEKTDCMEILARCPDCSRHVGVLIHLMGFRKVSRQEDCWDTPSGGRCGVDYYALSLEAWLARDLLRTAPLMVDTSDAGHGISKTCAMEVLLTCPSEQVLEPHLAA